MITADAIISLLEHLPLSELAKVHSHTSSLISPLNDRDGARAKLRPEHRSIEAFIAMAIERDNIQIVPSTQVFKTAPAS